jgi:hypothetical protein
VDIGTRKRVRVGCNVATTSPSLCVKETNNENRSGALSFASSLVLGILVPGQSRSFAVKASKIG